MHSVKAVVHNTAWTSAVSFQGLLYEVKHVWSWDVRWWAAVRNGSVYATDVHASDRFLVLGTL